MSVMFAGAGLMCLAVPVVAVGALLDSDGLMFCGMCMGVAGLAVFSGPLGLALILMALPS